MSLLQSLASCCLGYSCPYPRCVLLTLANSLLGLQSRHCLGMSPVLALCFLYSSLSEVCCSVLCQHLQLHTPLLAMELQISWLFPQFGVPQLGMGRAEGQEVILVLQSPVVLTLCCASLADVAHHAGSLRSAPGLAPASGA